MTPLLSNMFFQRGKNRTSSGIGWLENTKSGGRNQFKLSTIEIEKLPLKIETHQISGQKFCISKFFKQKILGGATQDLYQKKDPRLSTMSDLVMGATKRQPHGVLRSVLEFEALIEDLKCGMTSTLFLIGRLWHLLVCKNIYIYVSTYIYTYICLSCFLSLGGNHLLVAIPTKWR